MHSYTQPIRNQKGQTLIEYLIIVALVGVGSIGLMRVVSQGINDRFASVVGALGGTVESKATVRVSSNMLKKKDLKNFAHNTKEDKGKGDSDGDSSDKE